MIPIEQTSQGMVVFLDCGCAAWRHLTHPTGAAALVEVFHPCEAHSTDSLRFRSVLKGVMVSPFVRTLVNADSITTR
jgi:hypothetical protein